MADNARLQSTTPSAGGSAVGRELRESREALGITIPQLADALRIRAAHIAALEEGRFNDLPGRPYAFGFARSIARHLGLDPEVVAARLRDEVMGTSAPVELVFPESTEDKRLSRTGWVLISLVAVVVAYGGWIMVGNRTDNAPAEFSSDAPPTHQVPETVVQAPAAEPSAAQPNETTPSAQAGAQPSDATPAGTDATSAPPGQSPAAPRADAKAPASAAPQTATPSTAAPAESTDEVDSTPEPTDVSSAPAATSAARIVISARQEAWVQIQGSNGTTVFARTMRAGETYPVPDQRGLRLTTGNAGGIDIVVDGKPTPSLGGVGSVKRNVSLDPNRLKSGALE
ncbi:MAG TPA: RodZ domain-containing protein [Alphaproteobacteria bacterium]|nr:RodZ domain-containing protein [Alphaproteobacteria bacterium]